jgi:type IV secretion system protein VirB5
MKKFLIPLALTGGIAVSSAALAQIPVTDVASITTNVTNQIETIAKWKLQYEQMVSQINNMQRQYSSLTGSRGLGSIMNNPSMRDYLPQDWQGVYDSVKNGGYSGLSGAGKTVYDANKIYDAYGAAKGRINQIDQLMGQINQTQDPKAIAELQARIQVEQANIQNEQTKLQMYAMVAAAEDKVQQQRQAEINAKSNARRGWLKLPIASN